MRINQATAILLAGTEGRNTLQVVQFDVHLIPGAVVMQPIDAQQEYPDDYFMLLRYDGSPIIGKQTSSALYLSPKGYAHFRNAIAVARVNSHRNNDIESLDAHAEEWFNKIRQRKTKMIRDLQKKVDQLNAFEI